MMRTLFEKEIRYLAPVAVFFAFLLCGDIFWAPLTTTMKENSWFSVHPMLADNETALLFFYFLGFTLAYSLFPREYESKTIEFLHTLPITRKQLFWTKFASAASLILIVSLLTEMTSFVLQLPNLNSLSIHEYSILNSLKLLLITSTLALVGLAHGLILSVFRHFGVLLFFFCGWLVSRVIQHYPEFDTLSPMSIGRLTYFGSEIVIPWSTILQHVFFGLLLLLIAEHIWSGRGHQTTDFILIKMGRWPKLVGCGIFVFAFGLLMIWALGTEDEETYSDPDGFHQFSLAKVTTSHYHFTYPSNLHGRATGLASRADDIYKKTFRYLGDKASDGVIVGDLTDVSHTHLGIATRGKLRIDLTNSESPDLLDHILCHETSHVLAYRLSGRRGQRYARLLSTFHEGTASYYAYKLTSSQRELGNSRRQALALHRWHSLKLEDLFDSETLEQRLDQGATYALGELWVQALVDAHGEDAPAKIWRAVNRSAKENMESEVFWRDTYQSAGLSLEKVRAAWNKRLDELEEANTEFLKSLPKLSVKATEEDGYIVLVAVADKPFPDDWPGLSINIREQHSDISESLPVELSKDKLTATAWVPDGYGDTFHYQVAISFDEDTYAIVNEWRAAKGLFD